MGDARKFKILLSIIFVLVLSSFAVVYTSLVGKNVRVYQDLEEEVLGRYSQSGVPYIISLAPIVVYEGEKYEYHIKVVDSNTDEEELEIEYLEGPDWLILKRNILEGTPPSGSVGTFKIVLRVSDGVNTSSQESYILVEKND
jgi:hypothetical protein